MVQRNHSATRRAIITRVVIVSVLACSMASTAGAARAHWHDSFEEALQAASQSHKPILVFAYVSQPGGVYDYAHAGMLNETLVAPDVVKALNTFEPVLFDIRKPENSSARRRLGVSPVVTGETGVIAGEQVAEYPVTLFLDYHGDELFRRHGYLPPEAYQVQLQHTANLFATREAVTERPDDPVAHRDLGRAYMEMDFARDDPFYRAAVENLERAIALDPENRAGARYNAQVDLAILHMPDDPQQAVTDLSRLLGQDPNGPRRFEIQFYLAVAQYALGNTQEAVTLLKRFETSDRSSPYFDNAWTPQALGLLRQIERQLEQSQ